MQSVIDFLFSVLEYFVFWDVINEYEEAIVLRLGKYKKTWKPGLHFCYPFGIDEVTTENIVPTTEHLDTQTLDTFDNIGLIICPVVTWRVSDIKTMLLSCEDPNGVLVDKVSSLIGEMVGTNSYDEIATPEFWKEVTTKSRQAVKKYGMRIEKVQYSDLAKMRTIRLINE